MAGVTDVITIQYSVNGVPVTKTVTTTAGARVLLSEAFASDAADVAMNLAVDVSALKQLIVESTVDCTVETNSSSAADDTLTLLAGVPLIWYPGCGHANPLGTDVTVIYVTNDSDPAAAGELTITALVDPTPA